MEGAQAPFSVGPEVGAPRTITAVLVAEKLKWGSAHFCQRCRAQIVWNEILGVSFCPTSGCVGFGWAFPLVV